jgi:hypothetical protein
MNNKSVPYLQRKICPLRGGFFSASGSFDMHPCSDGAGPEQAVSGSSRSFFLPSAGQKGIEEEQMRIVFQVSLALTALLTLPLDVSADDVPVLDVQPICHGIASQAANPTERGGPDLAFADCIKSERTMQGELAKVWSTFGPAEKGHCVRLATLGGEPSYTELITCLEMARDVNKMRSADRAKGTN